MKSLSSLGMLAVLLVLAHGTASAAPILQLHHLEGATCDQATQRWVPAPQEAPSGGPVRLWPVGKVAGPGGVGVITDVGLSVALEAEDLAESVAITPSPIIFGDFPGRLVADGLAPVLGGGTNVSLLGVFGVESVWFGYPLGGFTLTNSPVADLVGSFPGMPDGAAGQIGVYEVCAIGYGNATLPLDLPNAVISQDHPEFSLFCSDADGEHNRMPEPGAVVIWLLIGLTWAGSAWVYQYCSRWRQWKLQPLAAVAAGQEALELREQQIVEAELQRESGVKTQELND